MLTGVNPKLRGQLDRTGTTALIGEENLFVEQTRLGAAMNEAIAVARAWLEEAKLESTEPE